MEQDKVTLNKKYLVLTAVILVLLAALMAVAIVAMIALRQAKGSAGKEVASDPTDGVIAYESNLITDDADALQNAVDALYEKAKEGEMALKMQTEAVSSDGKNFQCFLANSEANSYDMYMVFYEDATGQEIYRSGLIPVGSRIEEFTLNEKLGSGSHEITIVYNQVESDKQTIHAQVNVGLTLIVQ